MTLTSSIIKNKGRGVLADKNYKKGQAVCSYDVIVNNVSNTRKLRKTNLRYYLFDWPNQTNSKIWNQSAICLGLGSIFNHANKPNIVWQISQGKKPKIIFKAKRNIRVGEELVHNYNWPRSMSKGLI